MVLSSLSPERKWELGCSRLQKGGFAASCKNVFMKRNFLFAAFAFLHPLSKIIFCIKNLISRGFWKVHNIAFKNFWMGRGNFYMLQKFYSLVLQPRKTPMHTAPRGAVGHWIHFVPLCRSFGQFWDRGLIFCIPTIFGWNEFCQILFDIP